MKKLSPKPIKFSNDIVPRIMPFINKTIIDYGKNCFIWLGPNPAMLIMDTELIREILSKINIFQKTPSALTKLLGEGILSYEADKWAKHRRIINPDFHIDKLKVLASQREEKDERYTSGTRAREEILQVFGNNIPDYDKLNQLKVVTMIIQEVLRLYPPSFLMGREVNKETKLGNLSIPSGVQLLLPTILLHHDQEIWGEDAKEFNPEWFSGGVNKATKGKFAYFPFSWGPRNCIAQNFAMLEAKMALAMILQHYDFEVSPSYAHVPSSVFTLVPQYGAQLILHKL